MSITTAGPTMKAAWYEAQGAARDVFTVGRMPRPEPGAGEVRLRIAASGINPGDLKKREDAFGLGMSYPRVVPHSDGAGVIDAVGAGVAPARIGQRVWCFGAQSYRPFGTAAEWCVVPAAQAVPLPAGIEFELGACLGIAGLTAHRAVHAGGAVTGRTVLVQGGAGGVGVFAVGLAHQAGARVIATVRSPGDEPTALAAGAQHVVCTHGQTVDDTAAALAALAPAGVAHVVEVAFDANIELDERVMAPGASIAAYASGQSRPTLPFWALLFKNARILLLGSDDFSATERQQGAEALNALVAGGWRGVTVTQRFALDEIAHAHEWLQARRGPGRVVLRI